MVKKHNLIRVAGQFHLVFMVALVSFGVIGTWQAVGEKDAASWIQAIWSVAGVFLAISYPQWHAYVLAEAEYNRQKDLLAVVVINADALVQLYLTAKEDDHVTQQPAMATVWPHKTRWDTAYDALKSFPITAFRSGEEMDDFMAVRICMAEIMAQVTRVHEGKLSWFTARPEIVRLRESTTESWTRLMKG